MAIIPCILIGLAIFLVLRRKQRNDSDDVHRLPTPVRISWIQAVSCIRSYSPGPLFVERFEPIALTLFFLPVSNHQFHNFTRPIVSSAQNEQYGSQYRCSPT